MRLILVLVSILLPGFFMQNFLGTIGKVTAAVLREGLKPDTKVQLIAANDIGAIARVVFEVRVYQAHYLIPLSYSVGRLV